MLPITVWFAAWDWLSLMLGDLDGVDHLPHFSRVNRERAPLPIRRVNLERRQIVRLVGEQRASFVLMLVEERDLHLARAGDDVQVRRIAPASPE